MTQIVASRPWPVVKYFYGFAYVVTVVEAASNFISKSKSFSVSAFSRSEDELTVWGMLVILGFVLSSFLVLVYFLVEQYESGEGIFSEISFRGNWRSKCELVLRAALFVLVSLKFIRWSDSLDRAAQFLMPFLLLYLIWFALVSGAITRPKDGLFSAIKVVGLASLVGYLPLLGASYTAYHSEHRWALLFVISLLIAAGLLSVKSILMALLVIRDFRNSRKTVENRQKQ